ncbi:MAG: 16S rRNA (adenine(1518)-N(6)/adenine(1519)-N(6))-dimethyltransferase RsmA [Pseudomonadota bacterium]
MTQNTAPPYLPPSPSPDLPPLREVVRSHGLDARKALGQHFLLDMNITRKIARLATLDAEDTVIEVGPGPGGLTRALLEIGARVTVIERDQRCLDLLAELGAAYEGQLTIRNEDALRTDYAALLPANGTGHLISNLPYNISTQLLTGWLTAHQGRWQRMTLMFQKEVADRILAPPGDKTYGRLSVLSQSAAGVRRGFDLPARAFTPPPKVASSVVVFDQITTPLAPLGTLEAVTRAAFSQRRKMLRTTLKPVFGTQTQAVLTAAGIDPATRAEQVSVAQFSGLAHAARDRASAGN